MQSEEERAAGSHKDATLRVGLLAQAQRCPAAFAQVYEQYCPRVYRYCLRRLARAEEAEDATAVVFTRALAGLHAYRGGSEAAWLFRIAHNTVISMLQARRTHVSLQDAKVALDEHFVSNAEDLVERFVRAEQNEQLAQMLASLRADQRELLLLRFAAGLKASEIGTILGLSEGAVRVAQHRAIQHIRQSREAIQEREDA